MRSTSIGSGSPGFMPERRGVDHEVVAGRVVAAGRHLQRRDSARAGGRASASADAGFTSYSADAGTPAAASDAAMAEPTPPLPTTSALAPAVAALALQAAHESGAVEHVAEQRAVGRAAIALHEPAIFTVGVTSSSRPTVVTLCGIVTSAPRMLVSRNSGAQEAGIVSAFTPMGTTTASMPGLLEVGVVDHRRLERLGGIAEMGDQSRVAADHVVAPATGWPGEDVASRASRRLMVIP